MRVLINGTDYDAYFLEARYLGERTLQLEAVTVFDMSGR